LDAGGPIALANPRALQTQPRSRHPGIDAEAPLYAAKIEVSAQFRGRAQREDLAAALKWRRAQFEE